MAIRVRALSDEEQAAMERLAHARTAAARLVERACIMWHTAHSATVPTIARQIRPDEQTVRRWLKTFQYRWDPWVAGCAASWLPTTDDDAYLH